MKRARVLIGLVGALALLLSAVAPAGADPTTTEYEVTITNLTDGQPLTPPLVLTHRPSVELFEIGEPASFEIKEIAENGNLGPALEFATNSEHVSDAVVAMREGDGPPPILSGESRTFEVTENRGAKFLSWASMLICTNDGFTGVDTVRLPRTVGDTVTAYTDAYDAGTEINTEDLADIVPPCQALAGLSSDDEGTGMSNPALAENGVIAHHEGIVGDDDLPESLDWSNPVAMIEITRTK